MVVVYAASLTWKSQFKKNKNIKKIGRKKNKLENMYEK